MNSQTFHITGEDFRDGFKREQEALRVARVNRLSTLSLVLAEAKDDLAAEYRATFECPASEGHSEADSAELSGQVSAERLYWLWENVVSEAARTNTAIQRAAAIEYLEMALEAITEAVCAADRERAFIIEAAAHLELFRLHDIDLLAHRKARIAATTERLAALKAAS